MDHGPAVRGLSSAFNAPAYARARLNRKRHEAVEDAFAYLGEISRADVVVHIENFCGDFAIDPRSDVFRRTVTSRGYEHELSALVAQRIDPTKDAIDVGANVGFYSVLLATLLPSRRVLAAEPTEGALVRLRLNIERNACANRVLVHAGALGGSVGTIDLNVVVGKEEYSSVGPLLHHSVRTSSAAGSIIQSVSVTPLDDLVELHQLEPGFIKIDVEGAEMQVLEGASKTLERFHPVILCEVSPDLLLANRSSAAELVVRLKGHGYKFIDPTTGGDARSPERLDNIVCIPA
jgi:FkbM family methyltransferase